MPLMLIKLEVSLLASYENVMRWRQKLDQCISSSFCYGAECAFSIHMLLFKVMLFSIVKKYADKFEKIPLILRDLEASLPASIEIGMWCAKKWIDALALRSSMELSVSSADIRLIQRAILSNQKLWRQVWKISVLLTKSKAPLFANMEIGMRLPQELDQWVILSFC